MRRKYFFLLLTMILIGVSVWAFQNQNYLKYAPNLISAYYAKQFCSCFYVMKRSEEYCHDWTKQWIPISHFDHDQDQKTVEVQGMFRTSHASWLDERQGCRLVSEK